MKQLLVIFAIILTSIPAVFAEDDKWIDGIMLRASENEIQPIIGLRHNAKENDFWTASHNSENTKKVAFPVIITFPELMMNSWSFRNFYIDYQQPTVINNVLSRTDPKDPILSILNPSEKAIADSNNDWGLTVDTVTSRFILGYSIGFFFPRDTFLRIYQALLTLGISELIGPIRFDWPNIRLLQFSAGLNIFYENYSYKFKLCPQWDFGFGDCIGATEIDSVSGSRYGTALSYDLTLWQKRTKESVWKIFRVFRLNDRPTGVIKLKKHDAYMSFSTRYTYGEFFSYTYRF